MKDFKDFKLEEHQKIAPGFKIPDGYFDNLAELVMQKIPNDQVKIISISKYRNSRIFTAAAILVLSLAIPALNKMSTSTVQPDAATLENYLSQSEISDDEIVALLETEDIQKITIDYDLNDNDLEEALSGRNIENFITE